MSPTAVEAAVNEKDAAKARAKAMSDKEKKLNEGRTGKGLRVFLSLSRGRNPQEVQYEGFDDTQSDTLPTTLSEFMDLAKVPGTPEGEKLIVQYLIDGFNSAQYTAASDPIAEFIEASWPDDVQKQFRTVVRNYASGAQVSIEEAVELIKPGVMKAQAAAKAS